MSSANLPWRHPRQIIIKGDVWSDTERLSSSDNVYVGKYRLIIINIYRGVTNRITFLTTLLLLLWFWTGTGLVETNVIKKFVILKINNDLSKSFVVNVSCSQEIIV